MPHLLLENGNGIPHKHELEGDRLTVGRNPDNGLVLDSDSISSHHAEIEHKDGGFIVRDLGSSNGTKLNGKAIQEAAIKDGDTITLGPIEARFIQDSQPPAREATPLPETEPEQAVKQEVKNLKSISSSLRHTAAKVMSSIGVAARTTALKARIEKLKRIDLKAAHYALGKKCYEHGLHRDQFTQQFEAIATLEKQIEEKGNASPVADKETSTAMMKRVGADAWASTEAAALQLKLKRLITDLGKSVAENGSLESTLEVERAAIAKVLEAISDAEGDASKLGTDLKSGFASLRTSRPFAKVKRRQLWIGGLTIAALVLVVGILASRLHSGPSAHEKNGGGISKPFRLSLKAMEDISGCHFVPAPPAHGPNALLATDKNERFIMLAKGPPENLSSLELVVIASPEEEVVAKQALVLFQVVLLFVSPKQEADEWVTAKLRASLSNAEDYEPPTKVFNGATIHTTATKGLGVGFEGLDGSKFESAHAMVFTVTITPAR